MKKVCMIIIILCMCVFPTQMHAQQPFRFLAFGNSLTVHFKDNIWWSECGMAASRTDLDWVHRVNARLQQQYGNVQTDIMANEWTTAKDEQETYEKEIQEKSQTPYDLVTIEQGDNIGSEDLFTGYEENLTRLVNVIRNANPNATIVIIGNFQKNSDIEKRVDEVQQRVATTYGCKFVDLTAISKNLAYRSAIGATVYGEDGQEHKVMNWTIARHPNDKGMEYIAYKVLEQLGISFDVGHDFDDLNTMATTQSSTGDVVKINGWQNQSYYFDGHKAKGLTLINKNYYYFNDAGILQKGLVRNGKVTYFLDNQGKLLMKKVNNTYFNSHNRQVSLEDGREYELLSYVQKNASKYKGKKKLEKAFKAIHKKKYKNIPKAVLKKGYPSLYAYDYFVKRKPIKNSLQAASCFAYLAKALGYKKIYVVTDRKDTKKTIKCFVEINGKVYDPSSNDKKKNYNITYKTYGKLKKKYKQKVPYNTMKAVKVKYSSNKGAVTTYDPVLRQLYYSNGQYVTGTVVYQGEFYAFDQTGNLDQGRTYKLRDAATSQNEVKYLTKLIGQPLAKQYSTSCFGDGDDGLWDYGTYMISTFRSKEGVELYIAAKEK